MMEFGCAKCVGVCTMTSSARKVCFPRKLSLHPAWKPIQEHWVHPLNLLCTTNARLHPCALPEESELLRSKVPKTVPWDLCASLSGAKHDSGRRRPALIDSRTLHISVDMLTTMHIGR